MGEGCVDIWDVAGRFRVSVVALMCFCFAGMVTVSGSIVVVLVDAVARLCDCRLESSVLIISLCIPLPLIT